MLPDSVKQISRFAAELAAANVIEMPDLPGDFHCTDLGNAQLFARWYRERLRYCHALNCWFVWDGKRWKRDGDGAAYRVAQEFIEKLYLEAGKLDSEQRKRIRTWAGRCEERRRLDSLLHLARNQAELVVSVDELDADDYLFNADNGTLNLRTFILQPHDPADLITKISPAGFDPEAVAPLFDAFVVRTFCGDNTLIDYLQRYGGYCLTGDTSDQSLCIAHGTGANGKGVLFGTLQHVMGDYALVTPADTVLAKREAGGIPNDVARMVGARAVFAQETDDGKRIAESRIKSMTGGDKIAARFMRAEWFEFTPKFKLCLATNHKPAIGGTDHAIWRRIRLIPFNATIPDSEQDPYLLDKLKTEASGILRWLVDGCREWQRNGLQAPDAVIAATTDYKTESDVLGSFIEDCCVTGDGFEVKASRLYGEYKKWTDENGQMTANSTAFGRRLTERGFQKKRRESGNFYLGIGLDGERTTEKRERMSWE